jgi:hypothetical protein
MMSAEFYQGAKLRGQQHDFSKIVHDLLARGKTGDVFEQHNLLRATNKQLSNQLRQTGDARLSQLISDMSTALYPHSYYSFVVDDDSEYDDSWQRIPVKIKPGLDTKVLDGDQITTLGDYAKKNENSQSVRLLSGVLDSYQGKTRLVKRAERS